jgi:hypothetical protein
LFNSALDKKGRTKKWKVEEMRDPVEATVEEEEVMEEEEEAGDIVEGAEVEAEAMAAEAAAVVMEGAVDMGAARAAVEASSAIGAQSLWRRVRRSMLRLIQSVGEATGSPASTTL